MPRAPPLAQEWNVRCLLTRMLMDEQTQKSTRTGSTCDIGVVWHFHKQCRPCMHGIVIQT